MESWLNQPLARLSECDRESPRVQDANRQRNLDPPLQFPRGTNEITTAVCFRERADVREKKARREEDKERGARVRTVEEKWDEEERNSAMEMKKRRFWEQPQGEEQDPHTEQQKDTSDVKGPATSQEGGDSFRYVTGCMVK
ncbi:hypothetical protein NDU88_000046 [Pleurodeles waltl]|uniref:Uncharacterized protein n=1 Tax=Pleurodeles waltl TaxID=8319 RepID=A0AAV7UQJ8_PLEWA|nr:hypothetical protein NDU88_000046 [Pleurodeles waltl]